RVRHAFDNAHGVCLRHAAAVAADRDAAPVVSRLVTQLLLAQRDLADDAWRRIPALLDGEVYLGLATWSSSSAT
ncbi:MAG: hypothetical protein ACRDPD_30875, partial [Streptosporangiaceae bacterium]